MNTVAPKDALIADNAKLRHALERIRAESQRAIRDGRDWKLMGSIGEIESTASAALAYSTGGRS